MCKALAVANEPFIFWNGENAAEIISNITVPKGAGYLREAEKKYNGPSGRTLDDLYLSPLGFSRDDAWLCDLIPYSCRNPSQAKAIEEKYTPLCKKFALPEATIPKRQGDFTNEKRRNEIISELMESQADKIILLGDKPVRWFLFYVSDCKKRGLADFSENDYGTKINVHISGKEYGVLPLVHPRQAGALGTYSKEWNRLHIEWAEAKRATRRFKAI
jgi:hypothetical protein